MRVTFSPGPGLPGLDLELAGGATLGSLRGHLATVTRCAAARSGQLAVGAVVLDDSHLVGTFPLVAGARLSVGSVPSADDGVFAAVRAERHLTVLAGVDAGLLWPVPERLEVGRGLGTDRLDVADPLVSHRHLEVRTAVGRVWVRDLGSVNGSRRSRGWSGHRVVAPVPRWWTTWGHGDRITIGTTVLELRTMTSRQRRSFGRKALLTVAALGPGLGSIALVAGTGNPALLALGAVGPALAAVLHRASPPPVPADESTSTARGGDSRISSPHRPQDLAGEGSGIRGAGVTAADLTASAARAVLTGQPEPTHVPLEELAPTGTLAVCGPGAREVAATLVLGARPSRIDTPGAGAEHWSWTHWLKPRRSEEADAGPEVVVVDGTVPDPGWGGPGRVVVLVDPERVPSWCAARLDARTGRWSGPEGERSWLVLPGSPQWAERQARLVAGARSVHAAGDGGLPESVTLGGLGLPARTEAITAGWLEADEGLRAVLGAGPSGREVTVDLAREGPHALVAGTTGSGKSEALRALVASLALRYPPTALAFALVDFKGGAGFGALSALPHVVGTVTDLDAHEAARAIGGLAAELRSRKALLARVGVTDLRDWPAHAGVAHPGRLVVVVDEFRALAEELPELMGALVRVATQGRSLGVHLVLATQRPSGVVSAELRANVALRLALRVTDAGDSSDVIDVPDAAAIPPSLPGRALLRRGPGPVEEVQVALVGAGAPPVRLAANLTEGGPEGSALGAPDRSTQRAAVGLPDDVASEPPAEEPDEVLVEAVTAAARSWRSDDPRPTAPWLPALPDAVTLGDLEAYRPPPDGAPAALSSPAGSPDVATPVGRDRLPIALADEPDTQSRAVVSWEPGAGHLLAVGGPGSGRSTLLRTVAAAALHRGWAVHAVGLPSAALDGLGEHPGLGTLCPVDDPRRLARLVLLLAAAPARTVLLIDGIEAAWQALESVARGEGAARFIELLRARAVGVVMTGSGTTGPWSNHANERLVLPVGDSTAEELAGVPRAMSGGRRGPGRAVWLPARSEALVCQVARAPATDHVGPVPSDSVRSTAGTVDDDASDPGSDVAPLPRPPVPPVRLAPVPLEAERPRAIGSRRRRLLLGVGGDAGGPLGLDPAAGGLVVGPPGSGRSTALAHVVLSAAQLGLQPVTIARDGPALAAARANGGGLPFDREAVLEALERREPHDAVVVDELDALARLVPDVAEVLDELVDDGAPVFASLTTTAALGAYRGTVAVLRGRREGVVLGAHVPGSDEVFGTPLAWHVDAARPALPGRGVLQRGSRLDALQVFAPPQ